jgi:transposase
VRRFAPLQAIAGLGPLTAAALVAELGALRPGFGESQLAALAGVAPLEASSAGGCSGSANSVSCATTPTHKHSSLDTMNRGTCWRL